MFRTKRSLQPWAVPEERRFLMPLANVDIVEGEDGLAVNRAGRDGIRTRDLEVRNLSP